MDKAISNKINLIRIVSMILIILCHYFQYYNLQMAFWLNVGVQIFFILSGFLYGTKDVCNIKKFWKSKMTKIVLPYYIILICFFTSCYLFKIKFSFLIPAYYLTFTQAYNINFQSINHLWFMSYIMLFYLFIPIIQKFDFSKDKDFWLKLLLLVCLLQFFQFVNIINVNVTYVGLFITSYYISRRIYKHNILVNTKNIFVVSLIFTVAGILLQLYLQKHLNFNQVFLSKIFYLYCDYVHAILGISLFLVLLKILPNLKNKIIDYLSKVSFYVYLVHHIFILGPFSLLKYNYGLGLSIVIIIVASNLLMLLVNNLVKLKKYIR